MKEKKNETRDAAYGLLGGFLFTAFGIILFQVPSNWVVWKFLPVTMFFGGLGIFVGLGLLGIGVKALLGGLEEPSQKWSEPTRNTLVSVRRTVIGVASIVCVLLAAAIAIYFVWDDVAEMIRRGPP